MQPAQELLSCGKCSEVKAVDNRTLKLWLWSVLVFTPGSKRLWQLSANYDDIFEFTSAIKSGEISGLTEKEIERAEKITYRDVDEILERCDDLGMKVYCYESEGYPKRLKGIADPPAVLFAYGNLDFLNDKCVISVVGARKPSEYSVATTERICKDLIGRNILLASGFAGGIDQIANNVAVECGSFPIAVSGAALDSDYPKGSGELKNIIAQKGVMISELYPGCRAYGNAFVNRNRILMGISDAVLFAECSQQSHGLDNFDHALSQGKQIFVIPPHDIYDSRYFGQRDLIRNECQPVFGAEDIVYSLGCERFEFIKMVKSLGEFTLPSEDSAIFSDGVKAENTKPKKRRRQKAEKKSKEQTKETAIKPQIDYSSLDEQQQKLCRVLEGGNMLADELAQKLEWDISDVLAVLTELEMYGVVRSFPGKMFGL